MLFASIRTQIIIVVIFTLCTTGCESIRYYGQAICGQVSILNKRQPIDRLLTENEIPEKLKVKLKQVLRIQKFAENELHLPANKNNLSFVELERSYVVWNVFAAPEFSFAPKTWCFPIIGCTAYRGYFSEKNARTYAEKLKKTGVDIFIGGVTAYSTLGWFDDPILSTVIYRSEAGLAALIFHELAHQILYVRDDTTFNESFATAVEQEGLRRWMLENGNMTGYKDYLERRQRREKFISLITKYREKLEELYRQRLKPSDMRHRKAAVFLSLKNEYATLKSSWGGYAGYDAWFEDQLNNAKLNSIGAYYDMVPAFNRLLASENGNLEAFYEKCRILSDLPPPERGKRLNEWQSNSTPEIQAKNGKQQR